LGKVDRDALQFITLLTLIIKCDINHHMNTNIDKRIRAHQFRDRLRRAMADAEISQSALARAIRVERSTISQVLNDTGARLPNAQFVGECAAALNVSADWLLSLSNRPENASDLLAQSLELTRAPRALIDEQIFEWHKEAAGYKIRHVPATLPDMFKSDEFLEWEYAPHLGRTTQQAIGATRDRLNWMRQSKSDYEIAFPLHEIQSLATGTGYYADLPIDIRQRQIERLSDFATQFYPRVRIYVFDAKMLYSAPITIFGPLLAVMYMGQNYLVFRDTNRIETFVDHFDALVRQAMITTRDVPEFLKSLSSGG
jgi:transcriptional regulator with XRE-family HTH domain